MSNKSKSEEDSQDSSEGEKILIDKLIDYNKNMFKINEDTKKLKKNRILKNIHIQLQKQIKQKIMK